MVHELGLDEDGDAGDGMAFGLVDAQRSDRRDDLEGVAMKDKVVLIVDDSVEILRATSRLIGRYWMVETAATVGEAITKLPVADVILSDWDMPEGGGRKILEVALAPVVIHSGGSRHFHSKEDQKAMERAAGFIEKPASIEDLDKILYQALLARIEHDRNKGG